MKTFSLFTSHLVKSTLAFATLLKLSALPEPTHLWGSRWSLYSQLQRSPSFLVELFPLIMNIKFYPTPWQWGKLRLLGPLLSLSTHLLAGCDLSHREITTQHTSQIAEKEQIILAFLIGKGKKNVSTRAIISDLSPFFSIASLLEKKGGEIKIFHICQASENTSFLRFKFDPAPAPLKATKENENPLLIEANKGKNDQGKTAYEQRIAAHKTHTQATLKKLESQLPQAIAARDCEHSIMKQGLNYLNIIAKQPTPKGFQKKDLRFVIISDKIDKFTGGEEHIQTLDGLQKAKLYVATGDSDLGVLKALSPPPIHFESFPSLMDYLISDLDGDITHDSSSYK